MSGQPQTAAPAPAPAVVVFGRDDKQKPHASSFPASDAALAEKAAGLMGMRVLTVTTDAERALATRVPRGKIFALCVFLGATGIGWAVALVWALLAAHLPQDAAGMSGGESGLNIFANDTKRIALTADRGDEAGGHARSNRSSVDEVLQQIERLEKLRAAGHIDDIEFASLKAAALRRL